MEVSDYLKSGYQAFHKTQGLEFGSTFSTNTKSKRFKEQRKTIRHKLISERRLINEKAMSPYKTPGVTNNHESNLAKEQVQCRKRLEMLKKWKKEKAKKLEEEKLKTKPIFKVTHVPVEIGNINLENVNKVIKGKPSKKQSNIKKKDSIAAVYNFAPNNYQFKGPVNVKPVASIKLQNKCMKPVNTPSTKLVLNKKEKKVTDYKVGNKENMELKQLNQNCNTYQLRNRNVPICCAAGKSTKGNCNNRNTTKPTKIKEIKQKNTKALKVNVNLENDRDNKHSLREETEMEDINYSELSSDYPIGEYIDSQENSPNTPNIKNGQTPDTSNKSVIYIRPFKR